MNRRDAIKAAAVTAIASVATPAIARTVTVTGEVTSGGGTYVVNSPTMTPQQRKKQYAICKERGHQADSLAGSVTTATWPQQTPWEICKFCRTSFRTVVTSTQEETNTP